MLFSLEPVLGSFFGVRVFFVNFWPPRSLPDLHVRVPKVQPSSSCAQACKRCPHAPPRLLERFSRREVGIQRERVSVFTVVVAFDVVRHLRPRIPSISKEEWSAVPVHAPGHTRGTVSYTNPETNVTFVEATWEWKRGNPLPDWSHSWYP